MTSREQSLSQATPYAERFSLWEASIQAVEKHIELSLAFQNAGLNIVTHIQNAADTADPSALLKSHQTALLNIERGIKLERDARQELSRLHHAQPKK